MSTALIWFKKDLRLHDNQAVIEAFKNYDQVIPFYCFEEQDFGKTSYGYSKTYSFRAQFLIESVSDLRKNLRNIGSDLIIRQGSSNEQLKLLIEKFHITDVYVQKEIHVEESEIQESIRNQTDVKWHFNAGFSLFHVNDALFKPSETPKVFTDFRKKMEKYAQVRACFETPKQAPKLPKSIELGEPPSLKDLGLNKVPMSQNSAIKPKGGESEALKRLDHYLYETESLSSYKLTRNGLLGSDYSSKFSIWLWNGCISPRKIYWEVKNYEKSIKKNQSTYWLIFELIWRDFFKFTSIKHGTNIFKLRGINGKQYPIMEDSDSLEKWSTGNTGIPFIDANMRELNQTGFMSNRGRQNVASFLVNELQLDWRAGAEYFESCLLDYDVASNYCNWMYIAGVGNDPRDRYFNIILQAKRYDPEGEYIRHWIPELKSIENKYIHHPWTAIDTLFVDSELSEYPQPIVRPQYWEKHY